MPAASNKIHGGSTATPSAQPRSYAPDDNDDDDVGDEVVGFFGRMFMLAFAASYTISKPQYDQYPYDLHADEPAESGESAVRAPTDYTPNPGSTQTFDRWYFNGDVSLLAGFDDDIWWYGLNARAHMAGLGVRGQWLQFAEDIGDDTFRSDLFDITGIYRIYEGPYWNMELGIGGLGYHDDFGTEWGAHLGIGADFFILEPLAAHAEIYAGSINDVSIRQGNVGLGVLWRHWEARLGYRWTSFEDVRIDGPEFGITFWY